jgi:DUF4097 and DUF4098 domain-containing protein YvlB
MMRTALVALLVGAVLTACGIRIVKYEFTDDHVVAEKFTSVRVKTASGDVSIRYQQGAETKIHRRVEHEKNNRPTSVSHHVEGTTLVLDDCGNDCHVNYDVVVSSPDITVLGDDTGSGDATIEGLASVDYKARSGNITVRDIAGEVRISTGSGNFEATKVRGNVTAHLGSGYMRLDQLQGKVLANTRSGDITGTGIDTDVMADAGSGDIDLTFASPRAARLDTGSGNIIVRVPASGSYKVSGDTNTGDRRVDVATSLDGQHELKLSTGSGDVRVLAI